MRHWCCFRFKFWIHRVCRWSPSCVFAWDVHFWFIKSQLAPFLVVCQIPSRFDARQVCWNDPHFCWNNKHFQKQLIFFGHKLTFLIVGFVSKPRIPMKHSILCHIPNIHWLLVKFPLFHTHCTPCLLLVASYPIFVGQYHNWLVVSTRKICGSSPRLLAKLQHILDHQPHSFSWPSDPNFVCGILQLVALRLSLSGHLQILAPRLRGLSSLALEQEETHGNPGGPKGFSRILA